MELRLLPRSLTWKKFAGELLKEANEDRILNGAGTLAFFLMFAIFPAMIFLLSLLPYIPVAELDTAIMELLHEVLPGEAAEMFTGVVAEITQGRKGGLLSFGLIAAVWTASSGTAAVMDQLNTTYGVRESRSYLKTRLVATGLTFLLGGLMISSFLLIVVGGWAQDWLASALEWGNSLIVAFSLFRWAVILGAMLLAFALTYYFGPDVEQRFRFISPGSVIGGALIIFASIGFRLYVENFGNYDATYGSIGAVMLLMLWLYVAGLVILLGSEINAVYERHHPRGKSSGEKRFPRELRG